MVVKLYHFSPSPPGRAVHMTLKALGIEHEIHTISTFKGENKTDSFLKINPRGKIPAIEDGDLCLGER